MANRRSFVASSAAALAALPLTRFYPGQVPPLQPGTDPLRNLIVVNGLGNLDNGYGPPPPGPRTVISAGALAAAKASGMTAINMTVASGTDFEDTIASIARFDEFIRVHPNDLLKVFTTADIRRAKAERKIGIIYGFQNAAMVGDKAARIDTFADLGVRCIQLTYNPLNQIGGGSMAAGDPGLTPFGREVVARLNAKRVMVDLSHSGRQLCLDAARASTAPISINHTGCRALLDHPRLKTDEELKVVADRGGYVGIFFIMYLARGRPATVDDVVAHIEHAIQVCGEDHVGFGSDYGIVDLGPMGPQMEFWANMLRNRASSGTAASDENPDILPFATGLIGPEQFRNLYRALERRRHSAALIEKIMGQNYLRFAREIWGA